MGANDLARYLANHGIGKIQRQNGKNPLFDSALIRRILKNPVYCGKIAYGRRRTEKVHGTRNDYRLVEQDNYLLVDGLHEALVSEELWHDAQVKLVAQTKKYEKVNHGKDNKVYLLTGLLKCPICGAGMYGNKSVKHKADGTKYKDFYYYGCKHVGNWGYKDEFMRKYNVYYSMKLFGDFIRDFPVLCSSTSEGTVTLLAGKSADGGKLGLLVTDYMGEGLDLSVRVTGVPAGAKARATVLDHERLLEPCAAEFGDGVLKLRKNRPESTAFCVTFERQIE